MTHFENIEVTNYTCLSVSNCDLYAIPEELVRDKQIITIKFQAKPGNTAGGVFGCRLLKAE